MKTIRVVSNRLFLFFIFVICCFFAGLTHLNAQKKQKVHIEHTDVLRFDKRAGGNIQKLIGHVVMRQDSTMFYCDSAYLDNKSNIMEAFGHVHIDVNDSVDVFGDYMTYNGNTRIAVLDSNVILDDKKMILTTDHLIYHRIKEWAFYNTGGKIINKDNVLTSRIGRYFTRSREFFFRDSVVLVNPDYLLCSDTLKYNTETEVVYIFGPTTIIGDEDSIYSEYGWYDTRKNLIQLRQNSFIQHGDQSLRADSLFYDREQKFGKSFYDVCLTDTVQDVIVYGQYAEFDRLAGYSLITDSITAILIDQQDSLFMHSDTIMVLNDSKGKASKILAYYKMKFYREDMQGMSDSLVYDVKDSTIRLYHEPVLWSDENQLTSDSIFIYVNHNRTDSISMFNAAFIVSRDDTATFNQIQGRQMTGYFTNNELTSIGVSGNAETIYFVREEDKSMIGINKSLSSYMNIGLEDNKIKTITYLENPDATLFPERELTQGELFLKGFQWLEKSRPMTKEDIFIW